MRIALGVCGGIAAYKAAELARALQQQAFDVEVVMTEAAQQFIRPLTFAALTGNKVITGLWSGDSGDTSAGNISSKAPNLDAAMEHIALGQRIDALVVAPATADMLARFAQGLASDFLSTLYLASTVPVIVAPAMNVNMWQHPATQQNLAILRARGVHIVEPGAGYLACGMTGSGRMAEPLQIAAAVRDVLMRRHEMEGETVLVTAGGTREPLDPVRFLGNRSSGKMGFALARQAALQGAHVILVAAPCALPTPAGCRRIDVVTSDEMRAAVLNNLADASIIIKAAAVSDYRPLAPSSQKIKRRGPLTLELEPTADILAEAALQRCEGTFVMGFAAETENPLDNASEKLHRKGIDAIVVNDVSREDIGFDSDNNAASLVTAKETVHFAAMSKDELATELLRHVVRLRRSAAIMASRA